MKKKKELIAKEVKKNITAVTESDTLSPQVMEMLEQKLPEFVKEYAADGTAVLRWSFEHLMIIEQILVDKFGFSEDNIVKLEQNIKEILPVITKYKAETPRILTKADYYVVLSNIERNKQLFKRERSKIALPDEKKIIK